jgi:hypothetical protein
MGHKHTEIIRGKFAAVSEIKVRLATVLRWLAAFLVGGSRPALNKVARAVATFRSSGSLNGDVFGLKQSSSLLCLLLVLARRNKLLYAWTLTLSLCSGDTSAIILIIITRAVKCSTRPTLLVGGDVK